MNMPCRNQVPTLCQACANEEPVLALRWSLTSEGQWQGVRAQILVGKGGEEVQGVPARLVPKSARGSRLTFRVPVEFRMGGPVGDRLDLILQQTGTPLRSEALGFIFESYMTSPGNGKHLVEEFWSLPCPLSERRSISTVSPKPSWSPHRGLSKTPSSSDLPRRHAPALPPTPPQPAG